MALPWFANFSKWCALNFIKNSLMLLLFSILRTSALSRLVNKFQGLHNARWRQKVILQQTSHRNWWFFGLCYGNSHSKSRCFWLDMLWLKNNCNSKWIVFSESREGPRSDEKLLANISKTDNVKYIVMTLILYTPWNF